jgi:hypothetical protein
LQSTLWEREQESGKNRCWRTQGRDSSYMHRETGYAILVTLNSNLYFSSISLATKHCTWVDLPSVYVCVYAYVCLYICVCPNNLYLLRILTPSFLTWVLSQWLSLLYTTWSLIAYSPQSSYIFFQTPVSIHPR